MPIVNSEESIIFIASNSLGGDCMSSKIDINEKMSEKEALLYKKILLEKDDDKRKSLEKEMVKYLQERLGAQFDAFHGDITKLKAEQEKSPTYSADLGVSKGLRRKLAATLSDKEFVAWAQSGGKILGSAVKLTNAEMELMKAGAKTKTVKYGEVSIITAGIGCAITYFAGNCSW